MKIVLYLTTMITLLGGSHLAFSQDAELALNEGIDTHTPNSEISPESNSVTTYSTSEATSPDLPNPDGSSGKGAEQMGMIDVVNIINIVSSSAAPEDPTLASPLTFLISRGLNAFGKPPLTVNYMITGTATNGFDYNILFPSTINSATIGADNQTIAVQMRPIQDNLPEGDETITLTLLPGTGYTLGTETTGTRTILDDDSQEVDFSVTPAPTSEGNSGTTNFNYTITRTGAALTSLEIQWTTSGTGTNPANGADFASGFFQTGTVTFGVGETEKNFTVQVAGDTDLENDETFQVSLSNPTSVPGVTFGNNNPVVSTILNDDIDLDGIPTMGQWAFFLFSLSLFTLMVVGLWNVKRSTNRG